MSPTKQLYDLQQLEVALSRSQELQAAVEAGLKDTRAVDDTRSRQEEAAKALEAMEKEQRNLELSVGTAEARIRDAEGRLYGGTTTNPKELQGLQQDVRMLRRQKSEEEDRLLGVMERAEEAQARVTAAQEELRAAEAAWGTERERLGRERERLGQEIARLQQEQGQASADVEPREMTLYQSLKASRGTAVSKVERGICLACGLSLPSHELQRTRTGQDLVRCGSCGRILYMS